MRTHTPFADPFFFFCHFARHHPNGSGHHRRHCHSGGVSKGIMTLTRPDFRKGEASMVVSWVQRGASHRSYIAQRSFLFYDSHCFDGSVAGPLLGGVRSLISLSLSSTHVSSYRCSQTTFLGDGELQGRAFEPLPLRSPA